MCGPGLRLCGVLGKCPSTSWYQVRYCDILYIYNIPFNKIHTLSEGLAHSTVHKKLRQLSVKLQPGALIFMYYLNCHRESRKSQLMTFSVLKDVDKWWIEQTLLRVCILYNQLCINIRCSGKRRCTISVPDSVLHSQHSCPKDLSAYLEASYICMPGKTSTTVYDVSVPYTIEYRRK